MKIIYESKHKPKNIYGDELTHAKHKYIKREKIKGKWRYYYDLDTLKKDVKSKLTSLKNVGSKVSSSVSKSLKSVKTKTENTIGSKAKDYKKKTDSFDKTVEKVKQKIHKYVAKVPTKGDTFRYFYSDKAYKAYLKGKDAAESMLNKNFKSQASDATKLQVKTFIPKLLTGGFGKAIFSVALPALTALKVEIDSPDSFDELDKTDKKMSNEEHQDVVNPKYDAQNYGYSMNCTFCTAVYDLRKRGYDVEANSISLYEGYTIDDVASWYDGAKVSDTRYIVRDKKKAAEDFEKELLDKYEDGARGHLAVHWTYGGGHDVVWEIENGKVVIHDAQIDNTVEVYDYFAYTNSYEYVRVDNCEPNGNVLRTVRNRK